MDCPVWLLLPGHGVFIVTPPSSLLPPCTPFPAPQSWADGCMSHFPVLQSFLKGGNMLMLLWLVMVTGGSESSCRDKHLTPLGGKDALQKG